MLFLILTTAKLFGAQLQLIVTFKNHSREIMIWLSAILSISWDVILCSRVYIVAKLVSPPGWKKTLITEIISHPILMSYDLFLLISWSSWKEMCTDQHSTEKYINWSSGFWIYCQKLVWVLWTGIFESFHVRVKDRFFLTFNSLWSIGRPRLMRYFQKAFLPILLHAPSVVKISFLGSHSVICTKKILKCCALSWMTEISVYDLLDCWATWEECFNINFSKME